jgi:hypothetical protein
LIESIGLRPGAISVTFRNLQGTSGVKTFLKVLLIVVAAIVAVKLLPATLAFGCLLALGLFIAAAVGVSLLAIGFCLALVVLAVLTPIWLPVLAIIAIVMLIRRITRSRA